MTFKIFPEAVEKPSTRDSIVETDVCKQDSFQELYGRTVIHAEHMKCRDTAYSYTIRLTRELNRCLV